MTEMQRNPHTPGPSLLRLILDGRKIRRQPLEYLLRLHQEYGDVVKPRLVIPTFIINNPIDIRHVLVTNPYNYRKDGPYVRGGAFFGKGLLSNNGNSHLQQRRIIQPMFHSPKLAIFAEHMTSTTQARISSWRDGDMLDLSYEMMHITLGIVGKSLFSIDLSTRARELSESLTVILRYLAHSIWHPLSFSQLRFSRKHREYAAAIERLDSIISAMILDRRAAREKPDDLLSMLLGSHDENGNPMHDQQIRDEVVTIMVAGHETTANALAWTWYLLSKHPEVESRLVAEVTDVLAEKTPTVSDLPKLRYSEMVFSEVLRLYPPVWMLSRRALHCDLLPCGVEVPEGAQVIAIPYIAHRNPEYFPEPDRFNPDRFDGISKDKLPLCTYFPFSVGPRGCIGEAFARMEALLIIAMIAQRFSLTLRSGRDVVPEPLLTLRPKNGLHLQVRHR